MGYQGGNRRNQNKSLPEKVTYKRPDLLESYIDEDYKVNSRRQTRLNSPAQRQLTKEIKRARFLALLPFTDEH